MDSKNKIETTTTEVNALSVIQKNEEDLPSLHDLPDDPVRRIFSFLSLTERLRLEIVCKRWETLLHESWKSVRSLSLAKFQVYRRCVTETDDENWETDGDAESASSFQSMYHMSALELVCETSKVEPIFQRPLCSLQTLSFEGVNCSMEDLGKILAFVAEADIPRLTELIFHKLPMDSTVLPLLQLFPALENLNLHECLNADNNKSFESETEFRMEIESQLAEIFRVLTHLREITVSGLEFGTCLSNLSPSLAKANIWLSENEGFGGWIKLDGFLSVSRNYLEDLRLPMCRILPQASNLQILVEAVPNLRILDLSRTQGLHNFRALAELKQLEELYMNDVESPDFWKEPEQEKPFLYYLSRSESTSSLEILHMNIFRPVYSETDQMLEKIGRFQRLKELSLEHCTQLTPHVIDAVTRECTGLECLLFHHGINLDDASLATIGRQSPNLRYLDTTRCPGVTAEGIKAMISGLETSELRPANTPLQVYVWYSGVEMDALQQILTESPWLKIDTVHGCRTPRQYLLSGMEKIYHDPCTYTPPPIGPPSYSDDEDDWDDDYEHYEDDHGFDYDYDYDEYGVNLLDYLER